MRRFTKVLLIFISLLFTAIVVVGEVVLPTDSYRNIFFFADVVVYKQILSSGHYYPITELPSKYGVSQLQYYPKIYNRSQVPVYGVWLTIFSYILKISPAVIYSQFPGFLVSFGAFTFIAYKLTNSPLISFTIGAVGMLSPTLQPIYSWNFNSVLTFYFLIGIYCLFYSLTANNKRDQIFVTTGLIIITLSLFYWYPPRAVILTAIITSTSLLAYFTPKYRTPKYPLAGLMIVIGYSILFLPLPSFIDAGTGIIINLLNGEIPLPTLTASSGGTTPYALKTEGYSWIAVGSLFVIGGLGGIIVLRDVIFGERDVKSILLFGWGIAIVSVIFAYLLTGTSWLTGRAIGLAETVMIFGAAIGLSWFREQDKRSFLRVGIAILLITSSASYALRANGDIMQLHTYQNEADDFAEWSSTHLNGIVVGDQKTGALLISNGYRGYKYPQSVNSMEQIFYSENRSIYIKNVCEYSPKYYVLVQQQSTLGLYVMNRPREPMSKSAYNVRKRLNTVYSNGEYNMINVKKLCQRPG